MALPAPTRARDEVDEPEALAVPGRVQPSFTLATRTDTLQAPKELSELA